MADTLQNKISQYRAAGGTLQETTPEELQTLAGKAGLQAQPTDPLSAQAIGAGPHQAKMAASPQVQQSALQLSQLDPSQGLAEAARRAQARTEATEAESAEKAKAEKLKNLGDTGTRVQTAIDAEIQKLAPAPVGASAGGIGQIDETAVQGMLPTGSTADIASVKADLQTLLSNPGDQQALLRVETALGRGPGNPLKPEELQGLYQSSVDAITKAGKDAVATHLTVGDLATQPGFGYSVDQLAGILGVPADQVSRMTVPDLQAAVGQLGASQFSNAATLDQKATSGQLGSAERATARDLGREASATGLRSTEADVSRIQESLARGDQVEFAGKTWSVEDLLGNSQVSKTISDYLTAPEGSPTRLQLSQTEPGLVKWIDSHQAVLSDASKALGASATQFEATQNANKSVGTYGGSQLSPDALSAILPGYDKLQAGALDTSKSPVLQHLSTLSPDQAKTAVDTINSVLTPEQQKELAGMSSSEVAALELGLGTGSPVLKALAAHTQAQKELASISPNDSDAVISYFMGQPGLTAGDAQHQVDDLHTASLLGLANYGTAGGLDKDRDGRIDSPADILAGMKAQVPSGSLKDAISGGASGALPRGQGTLQAPQGLDPQDQTIVQALRGYTADDRIDADDIEKSGITQDEGLLKHYLDSKLSSGLSGADRSRLESELSAYTGDRTKDLMRKFSSPIPQGQDLAKVIRDHSTDPQYLDDLSRQLRSQYQGLTDAVKDRTDVDSRTVQDRVAAIEKMRDQVDAAALSARKKTSGLQDSMGTMGDSSLTPEERKKKNDAIVAENKRTNYAAFRNS